MTQGPGERTIARMQADARGWMVIIELNGELLTLNSYLKPQRVRIPLFVV